MTIDIYWQLDTAAEPARGERSRHRRIASIAREVRTATQGRFDYYAQIAQGAAQTAFDGLFLPHREEADDSLIVAAALAREVQRLALVAQFPASVGSAVYAAKQAVSFQRATGNRLGWAISPDADIAARAGGADHVREEELGARAEEFLAVARGVHGESPFSFTGRHFEVQGGGFEVPLNRAAFPQVVGNAGNAFCKFNFRDKSWVVFTHKPDDRGNVKCALVIGHKNNGAVIG